MNRKERRALRKQDARRQGPADGTAANRLLDQAVQLQRQGRLDDAARLYHELLALRPGHADACNNLGFIYVAQGRLKEARVQFRQVLIRRPQLLFDFPSVAAMLTAVNPALVEAVKCAAAAWPHSTPVSDLLHPYGLAALADDPVLLHVLTSTTVRDIGFERLLTLIRMNLLHTACAGGQSGAPEHPAPEVTFGCALARQCFINEYVFTVAPEEAAQADALKTKLVDSLKGDASISPSWVAATASYFPLHSLPNAQALLDRAVDRRWPTPVAAVVEQQVREPWQELQLREGIPCMSAIADEVSLRVRQQYEEHPYPRWVHAAAIAEPITFDEHLREQFPPDAFKPLGKSRGIEILVAGCGTGRHPIELAQKYVDARVLAVDLSLASLAYAKRKTPPELRAQIEYAQADILALPSLGRTFDLIDASGVLHHLSDPLHGWRALVSLLRPGGFMRLGLYSELGRRDVVAARAFLAERGFQTTADDIRRGRQELLRSPFNAVAKAGDFFSTSECRDLLFHVQEQRMTIPDIKAFLAENGLRFVGFEFVPQILQRYGAMLGGEAAMRDLDRWHAFETRHPETFAGMYQFLVQRD